MKKIYLALLILLITSIFLLSGCTENSDEINDDQIFIENSQNYIYNPQEGLIWLKCDYGLAGEECNTPNYCGYNGTSQDSYAIKLENNPICDPEKNTTAKAIEAKCDQEYSNDRYVYTKDSGVAVCSNGVLCKDGSFIVVDWKEDYLANEEEYSNFIDITQKEYVQVTNDAKERACENHGGVAEFDNSPIYNWELPKTEELETLYDSDLEKIDSYYFPNGSDELMSITQDVGNPPNKHKKMIFNKPVEPKIENCAISAPVKCVFKVEPIEEEIINQDKQIFCSISDVKKIKINYKDTIESYKGIHYNEYETKIYSTLNFLKSYLIDKDEDGDWKSWVNYNKNTKNTIVAETWYDNDEEKCHKDNNQKYFGFPIAPIDYPEVIFNNDLTNETKIINGIECTLTKPKKYPNYGTIQECINKENCIIIQTTALTNLDWDEGTIIPAGRIMNEVTSVNKTDFDESILEIPDYCITISLENEETFNEYENDLASESNDCSIHCEEMKTTCEAQGMNYTYDGCIPFCEGSNCAYHRSCELSCYSN
ncbi:MAG: hypothetical protein WC915_03190 [archaeon]|jgi:hypothetical protein